jgi:hypothetical protein
LFHGTDGEWVIWTPQGYYTGSPGAGKIVGWQLNNGPDKAAEYVRGQQLRDKLLRPDIIDRAIILASATEALKEAGLENVSVDEILRRRPPLIHAFGPREAAGGRAVIRVASQKNTLPLGRVDISVSDGKQETKVEAKSMALPPGTPPPEKGGTLKAYEVPLFKGRNVIRVVATNAAGESEPQTLGITHNGEGALDKRGTLWVLAVGVNQYPGAKGIYPNLTFAGPDATSFVETASAEMKGTHSGLDVTLLVNGKGEAQEPTRANILAALERIRASSGENDTIAMLLAGHGENWQGGRYHFLPTDFKRTVRTEIGDNVIDWAQDIQPAIAKANGRKLVFLDACHSGNAYNRTLLAAADADRFVAFSAAGPDELANEFKAEGHGAFTYMLMQGLKGANEALDALERGVTVYTLGQYVNLEVRKRTGGKQAPEFRSGQGNFVLVRE